MPEEKEKGRLGFQTKATKNEDELAILLGKAEKSEEDWRRSRIVFMKQALAADKAIDEESKESLKIALISAKQVTLVLGMLAQVEVDLAKINKRLLQIEKSIKG